ncbi:MAG: hypothetical protein IIB25_10955 [Chloroflexi bacterium]|nr:hypothetical protein [Chloroflexota bacterium]
MFFQRLFRSVRQPPVTIVEPLDLQSLFNLRIDRSSSYKSSDDARSPARLPHWSTLIPLPTGPGVPRGAAYATCSRQSSGKSSDDARS